MSGKDKHQALIHECVSGFAAMNALLWNNALASQAAAPGEEFTALTKAAFTWQFTTSGDIPDHVIDDIPHIPGDNLTRISLTLDLTPGMDRLPEEPLPTPTVKPPLEAPPPAIEWIGLEGGPLPADSPGTFSLALATGDAWTLLLTPKKSKNKNSPTWPILASIKANEDTVIYDANPLAADLQTLDAFVPFLQTLAKISGPTQGNGAAPARPLPAPNCTPPFPPSPPAALANAMTGACAAAMNACTGTPLPDFAPDLHVTQFSGSALLRLNEEGLASKSTACRTLVLEMGMRPSPNPTLWFRTLFPDVIWEGPLFDELLALVLAGVYSASEEVMDQNLKNELNRTPPSEDCFFIRVARQGDRDWEILHFRHKGESLLIGASVKGENGNRKLNGDLGIGSGNKVAQLSSFVWRNRQTLPPRKARAIADALADEIAMIARDLCWVNQTLGRA